MKVYEREHTYHPEHTENWGRVWCQDQLKEFTYIIYNRKLFSNS